MAQYPQGIFQSLQYLLKKVKILALQKQPTYTSISTASAPYVIPGRGIYEITDNNLFTGYSIFFPNPVLCNGQTITVINRALNDQNVDSTNQPYVNGIEYPLSIIPAGAYYIFVSINGVWRGGPLNTPVF
jgi:hypothetical protein